MADGIKNDSRGSVLRDMTRSEAAEAIRNIFREAEFEWEDYGIPDNFEIETAIAMMQDEVDHYDQPVSMSVPGIGLKLDKDEEGWYNLYFFVGRIER
jgi:hypothetical protein